MVTVSVTGQGPKYSTCIVHDLYSDIAKRIDSNYIDIDIS